MNRHFPLYIMVFLLLATTVASCNKKDEPTTSTESNYSSYSYSTTLVSAFSLKANTKIAVGLDSVTFAIDQERGLIYNADSLPYGTRVTALCVNVTSASTVASRQFIVKNGTVQKDTIITYRSGSNDSIDFSGDVTLRVTSRDGVNTRDYKVKVNVHQQMPDLIVWDQSRRRDLPNVSSTLRASKTVMLNGSFMCLVDDNGSYVLSTTDDPMTGSWSKKAITFPFVPQVKSFTASVQGLYILDETGELYSSADMGTSWSHCGVSWNAIVGAYDDRILGVKNDGTSWVHDEYPARDGFVSQKLDSNFPVSGMSQLVMAANEWTAKQQAMCMGGVLASGALTNAVWGYDGERWGMVSNASGVLPAMSDATLFSYYTYLRSTTSATYNKRVTWMVVGGKLADGTLNTTTYISRNQGINWSKGEETVLLPASIPAFSGAQVIVFDRTLGAGAPRLNSYDPGQVTPVTQWDCSYIYLFGGYAANGTALGSVWEGVLQRLTFKPVF